MMSVTSSLVCEQPLMFSQRLLLSTTAGHGTYFISILERSSVQATTGLDLTLC